MGDNVKRLSEEKLASNMVRGFRAWRDSGPCYNFTFKLSEYTDRSGVKHAGRCKEHIIKVYSFPNHEQAGSGEYVRQGKSLMKFTFAGGDKFNAFECTQENNVNFNLAPLLRRDTPIGFILSLPSLPKFRAVFQSGVARRRSSSFAMWQNKFDKKARRTSTVKQLSPLEDWQKRFAAQAKWNRLSTKIKSGMLSTRN